MELHQSQIELLTVHFDSQELIEKAIRHIDEKLFCLRTSIYSDTGYRGGQTCLPINSETAVAFCQQIKSYLQA